MSEIEYETPDGETQVIFGEKIDNAGIGGYLEEGVMSNILDAFGTASQFKVTIYHKVHGVGAKNLVGNFINDIPDPETIGNEMGSGRLQYMINGKDSKGKKIPMRDFWIDLGPNFDMRAAENKAKKSRDLVLMGGGAGKPGMEIALLGFAKDMIQAQSARPDNSMEMFRIMLENQSKAEERSMRMMEKMSENFSEALKELKGSGNQLAQTLETVKLLKEAGSLFGGDSGNKSLVSEILEAITPLAQTVVETVGGRKNNPGPTQNPQIAYEEIPVEKLDEVTQKIIDGIDKLVLALRNPLTKEVVKKEFASDPIYRAILESEDHLRRIHDEIGEEKFRFVMGVLA
jgi:hypothetical protein